MPRESLVTNFAIAFARPAGVVAPLVVLVAMAGLASSALGQSFNLTGFVPPQLGSRVMGLSADGTVAAGFDDGAGARGFTWTAAAGRNNFGLTFPTFTSAYGISGNGLSVVGAGPTNAFKWSQAGGYQYLGVVPGYSLSEAFDASFDGSVVVGTLSNGTGSTPQAFRWTQATGMQGLGVGTTAAAVSGDGSTVIGSISALNLAFRWTSGAGLQFLQGIDGSSGGQAFATNNTGSIIVGRSGANLRTTMWTNGVPVELLSSIPNANIMTPYGVSDDGSVVAGQMVNGLAAVWTPGTRIVRLNDYLAANGVVIPAGVTLDRCTAVSADGRTFAGWASGTGSQGVQGFVATITPPCPADLDNDGALANGGTRDRAVTIDDLLYLLTAFESGNMAADLDNGSNTGTRDNAVTIEDLLYFLTHFEAGC